MSNSINGSATNVIEANFKKRPLALMIDDNYPLYEPLSESIADYYELDYAPDGFSALQMLKQKNYDLVLCDINMPFIDGLGLLEEFNRRGHSIPFIFITGKLTEDVSQRALQLGAYNIIEKPFDTSEVLEKAAIALKIHKDREVTRLPDQDRAYIYNALKTFSYDPQQILYWIHHYSIPTATVIEELDKKSKTGKCAFDEVEGIKLLRPA